MPKLTERQTKAYAYHVADLIETKARELMEVSDYSLSEAIVVVVAAMAGAARDRDDSVR